MSVQNINILQNPIDIAYMTSYSNEYMIQSLANLGQRLGIKGDSIKYNNFTFSDIYNNIDVSKYDSDSYNGVILYTKTENNDIISNFAICKKELSQTLNESNFSTLIEKNSHITLNNAFSKQFVNNNIVFDISINNITKYKYSSFSYKNDYFSNILYGSILNTEDTSSNNIEIMYNKYNTTTGILEYCVRAFYLYTIGNANYYCMMVMEPNDTYDNDYKLTFYLFNSSLLDNNVTKTEFENMFSYSKLNTNNIFYHNINDFNEFDDLFMYKNDNDCTLFGLIKHNTLNNELNLSNDNIIYITLNTNDNVYFTLSDNNYNKNIVYVNEILSKINSNILNRISFINNDIIYLYPNLLEFYSSNIFSDNLSLLYQFIIMKIYEYLYNSESDNTFYPLYIPLDYKFNYYGNSNNSINIYNSLDIYISLNNLNLLTIDELKTYFMTNKQITFAYNGIDKIININYIIEYDKKYNKYPLDLSLNKIYTLPYINQYNNWTINDNNSQISALGKNAGNPNIIILYNYVENDDIQCKIVCPYNIYNIQSTLEYVDTSFTIDPTVLKNSINYDDNILCKAKLPKITKSSISSLSDSIIFLISNQNCISNENVIINNNNDLNYFVTLWMIQNLENDNNGYSQFNYLTKAFVGGNDKYAFDISSLLNINNILSNISTNLEESEMLFDRIFINTISNEFKQTNISNQKIKGLIQNVNNNYYIDILNALLNTTNQEIIQHLYNYKNSLSLLIKYNNDVTIDDNNNKYITNQIGKYIKYNPDKSYFTNSVTNSLYPIFNKSSYTTYESISYTYQYNWEFVSGNQTESYIASDNAVSESINTIVTSYNTEQIPVFKINKQETQVIGYTYTSDYVLPNDGNYFYDEYIFSEDVPLLDLKEMLVVNSNVLNRYNILTLDKSNENSYVCNIYSSYIGSSFDKDSDKSHLVIGSSETNINIGTETLMSKGDSLHFKTQNALDINFNEINLNGNVNINNACIKTFNKNGTTYYVYEYDGLCDLGLNVNVDNGRYGNAFDVLLNNEDIYDTYAYTYTYDTSYNTYTSYDITNSIVEDIYNIIYKSNNNIISNDKLTLLYDPDIPIFNENNDKNINKEIIRISIYRTKKDNQKIVFTNPIENEKYLDYMYIPFLNINNILDNVFKNIYSKTLTELSLNDSNNIINIIQYVSNINNGVHKYYNNRILVNHNNKNIFLCELLCKNMGTLSFKETNDELKMQDNILLYDKLKFIIYKINDTYNIEIICNKLPVFNKIMTQNK